MAGEIDNLTSSISKQSADYLRGYDAYNKLNNNISTDGDNRDQVDFKNTLSSIDNKQQVSSSSETSKTGNIFVRAFKQLQNSVSEYEQKSQKAMLGEESVQELATVTAEVEQTVNKITALRDKAISAFKEIQNMQI